MVLVDSSIWIEAERPRGDLEVKLALKHLLEAYEVMLCSPVRLEVLGGARKPWRPYWQTFFFCLPYAVIQEVHWQHAVALSWKMRDQGQTLPWNDLLLAVLALENNCRVYTRDVHFEVLRQYAGVRLYQPGYGGAFAPDS